jgi:TolB-like protein
MAVADLGPTQLKNIERSIRVYSLQVGVPAQARPAAEVNRPHPKRRRALGLLAAAYALLLVLIAGGTWYFLGGNQSTPIAAPAIAVLPFDNLGGDEQASRLADGMTEDVITDLGRYKEFLVIGRNSTMGYKGRPIDTRQVAKDLNVRFVLAGSIQHEADRLRVTAQLIDAATGAQVWSERWDRPAQDLFSIQAEVADKVASSLGGEAGSNIGAIPGRLLVEAKKRAPAILSTYDLWLLGREQERLGTKEGNTKGFEYIDKAIALDPTFAPAYGIRGFLKLKQIWIFGLDWHKQHEEFGKDMRMAQSLDPTQYSAHAGMIQYFADMGQWAEASAEIDRALRDHPTNAVVLLVAAGALPYLGRPEEGVAMADLVWRLDPKMPRWWLNSLVGAYFFGRKFERVIELSDQVPEEIRTNYARFFRGASYAFLGRAEDAERAKADLIAKNGEQVLEIWFNEGEVFARTNEQDLEREGFRKLGLRICATEEELKKFDKPKRLPECTKT